ncbi:MAG: pyruvate kinase [Spirochaetes bacterium]|nr:pyruvate kinase [Spirochaetota bacterium]
MQIKKSTKLVCTIGPKSQDERTLAGMTEAGMDVVRMNMSHGSHDFHKRTIDLTREVSKRTGTYLGVMLDLQGPKIRTRGLMKEPVLLKEGQRFILTTKDISGTYERVSVNYEPLPSEVQKGEIILLDDGQIRLEVIDKSETDIVCTVREGGVIRSYRGLNLPDTRLGMPALTEKDIEDLSFGLKHGVDIVALSFVRRAADVEELRSRIESMGRKIPIVAKIEKPEAVENIDEIIESSDGVMVARGDLGAETSPQDVPVLQKLIIMRCNSMGKPVITATQMLESMISRPRPTRAEASDVANAIFDGTDSVMLSGETAVGEYPERAVAIVTDIARRAEREMQNNGIGICTKKHPKDRTGTHDVPEEICAQACMLADRLLPKLIIGFTLTGKTAARLSKYRPSVPILALCPNEEVLRSLSLYRGVHGLPLETVSSAEELLDRAECIVVENGLCREGDTVVFVGGVPVLSGVSTNMLKVHRIKIGDKNL